MSTEDDEKQATTEHSRDEEAPTVISFIPEDNSTTQSPDTRTTTVTHHQTIADYCPCKTMN